MKEKGGMSKFCLELLDTVRLSMCGQSMSAKFSKKTNSTNMQFIILRNYISERVNNK